jgi:hypothetical protein
MKKDHFRFLPQSDSDPEGTWLVLAPPAGYPILDATVRHVRAMQEADDDLKGELHESQRTARRLQKQVDTSSKVTFQTNYIFKI